MLKARGKQRRGLIMQSSKVAAGIVLYNPDNIIRLYENIDTLKKQVSKIYLFDNSTVELKLEVPQDVIYLREHDNRGIAYALNVIMENAKQDGFDWVITMDQDSILPEGMVKSFMEFIQTNQPENIGIICPQVKDKRRAYMEIESGLKKWECIDFCITSASCTSVEAWKQIGGFDEWLFIDLVDNDFCKRMRIANYKIIRMNEWVLDQEFGQITPKEPKKQQFWIKLSKLLHNANIAKFSYKKVVNPMRIYYTCRNIVYVNKKLKLYGKVGYENYNCKGYLGFVISFMAPSILRANDKIKVIKACLYGTRDGLRKKVEPWKN